jgi:hypothetical protein
MRPFVCEECQAERAAGADVDPIVRVPSDCFLVRVEVVRAQDKTGRLTVQTTDELCRRHARRRADNLKKEYGRKAISVMDGQESLL